MEMNVTKGDIIKVRLIDGRIGVLIVDGETEKSLAVSYVYSQAPWIISKSEIVTYKVLDNASEF